MSVFKNIEGSEGFFDVIERLYKETPRDQRPELVRSLTEEFTARVHAIRDHISEVEFGQHHEGLNDITHSTEGMGGRFGPRRG